MKAQDNSTICLWAALADKDTIMHYGKPIRAVWDGTSVRTIRAPANFLAPSNV